MIEELAKSMRDADEERHDNVMQDNEIMQNQDKYRWQSIMLSVVIVILLGIGAYLIITN